MKKLLILFSSFMMVLNSFAYHPDKIDEQLLRSFASNFPNAQKAIWQELDDAYLVSFIEDGIRIKVIYLKNGTFTKILRYYHEENLPLEIRLNIKKKYPTKKIYGVIELNTFSEIEKRLSTLYHVKLEDDSHWFTVRVEKNRKLKIVEKFTKVI